MFRLFVIYKKGRFTEILELRNILGYGQPGGSLWENSQFRIRFTGFFLDPGISIKFSNPDDQKKMIDLIFTPNNWGLKYDH